MHRPAAAPTGRLHHPDIAARLSARIGTRSAGFGLAATASALLIGLTLVWQPVGAQPGVPPPRADALPHAASSLAPGIELAAQTRGVLGSLEFRAGSLSAIPQWTGVIQRIQAEQAGLQACDADVVNCASPRVTAWRAKLKSLQGRYPLAQLQEINLFVNEVVPYRTDDQVWGRSDYWATPDEFLANAGDCEDFAIMKFVSLLELGFSNDQMRIVVLTDTLRNLAHAVLAVTLDGRTYILDNLFSTPVGDDALPQYVPQYSVNLTTRWAHIMSPGLNDQIAATN